MVMTSVKKLQHIYLPNGSGFELMMTKMLDQIGFYNKTLAIDESMIRKIKNEFAVYQWLIDYQEWLRSQSSAVNILRKNMRHLPKYEDMSHIRKVLSPPAPQTPGYQPEGNLNKLVLELIRKVIQSPNYTNEIGRAIGIDHLYWQRDGDLPMD